jgi:hypothetical protein
MMARRDDFYGHEFDWFAIDGAGSVALCCSPGYGEIPKAVLQDPGGHRTSRLAD